MPVEGEVHLHSFLPYLLSHTRKAQLCLLCSVASPKNTALHPPFEPRSTSLKKQTPICCLGQCYRASSRRIDSTES